MAAGSRAKFDEAIQAMESEGKVADAFAICTGDRAVALEDFVSSIQRLDATDELSDFQNRSSTTGQPKIAKAQPSA